MFLLRIRRPSPPTLFPYTTLFRSITDGEVRRLDGYVDSYYAIIKGIEPLPIRRKAGPGVSRCGRPPRSRSEEHTSELQSHHDLVCRLLLEKKKALQCHHTR